MKVALFVGVLVCASVARASVYIDNLDRYLGALTVTDFHLPSFVDKVYTAEEEAECYKNRGHYLNGTFVGKKYDYDVLAVLRALGGAPGEVNAPRRNEVSSVALPDPTKRPLDDPAEEQWLYDYRVTDYKNYFRLEHAVKRFPGTDSEFLDVRGRVAWVPEDHCGVLKVADYVHDDTGFHFEVKPEYCHFGADKTFRCATIPQCYVTGDGGRVCVG